MQEFRDKIQRRLQTTQTEIALIGQQAQCMLDAIETKDYEKANIHRYNIRIMMERLEKEINNFLSAVQIHFFDINDIKNNP